MPTLDPYHTTGIDLRCVICKNDTAIASTDILNFVNPCKCFVHKQCFMDNLVDNVSKCETCGDIYRPVDIKFMEFAGLLERYIPRIISNVLYLMPMVLCLGMLNVFNILTWQLIRLPMFNNLSYKNQIKMHILCLLIPIILGYMSEYNGIYNLYISGILIITSNAIYIANMILMSILFIFSNLLYLFLIGITVGQAFMISKNLVDHIMLFKQKST